MVLSLLTACGGGTRNVRTAVDQAQAKGLSLYQSGDYFNAIDWLEKSHQENSSLVVLLALMDAYAQLGETIKVYPLLNHPLLLNRPEKQVMLAKISWMDGDCHQVLAELQSTEDNSMGQEWQRQKHQMLAECHFQQADYLLAAASRFHLLTVLQSDTSGTDVQAIQAMQDALVNDLVLVDETDLILGIGQAKDPLWHGWLEAAFVEFGADGESGAHWLSQWENHPAASYFLDNNAITSGQKVAVLLPMSGRFEQVSKAIQQGMLTAAISQGGRNDLQFFDTGSQGEALAAALFSAQEAGVDMIVGPLDKQSITGLSELPEPTVPMLLLNQSDGDHQQFSLSPEAEAQDVAETMYQQGKRQVVIMSSNDPWGERLTLAFAQRFSDLGGHIIANHYFATDQADYSAQLRQALGLVGSRLRSKNLQQYLKLPVSSEEVVRADIDAIFLAAQPSFARMMVPQLKFHRASKVPVYATSHVFVGFNDAQHNKDLDGVHFPVAPLLLQTGDLLETLPFDVSLIQNTDLNLFAFGYDAFQLTSRLSWLGRVNSGRFSGLSGQLSMDFDGKIRRHLQWAYYSGGEVFAAED